MGDEKIKLMSIEEIETGWDSMTEDERNSVCAYQKLDTKFLTKHIKEVNWSLISINPATLTFEILDKFPSKISWSSICFNPKPVSESLMYNYRARMHWYLLLSHQKLSPRFLVIMSEVYRKSRAKNGKDFWDAVCRYAEIDCDYVDAYKRFINFRELSMNPNITPKTIDKYIMKLDPSLLMKSIDIPADLLLKYRDYFKNAK